SRCGARTGRPRQRAVSAEPSPRRPAEERAMGEIVPTEERIPRWDGSEFIAYGASGLEVRLPYELHDHCGFRATQIRELAWAFQLSDVMEDGLVSTKEARIMVGRLGEDPNDGDWLKMLNEIDQHTRGVLDFQHFVKLMSFFDRNMVTEDELVNAFKIFDKDRSGSIDAIEMQDLMKKLGFPMSPLEAHAMISEADDDDSGEVGYSEFVNKILNSQ
ncbi:unnamed protein product, partial [Prorocentrum cordatum]